MKLKDGWMLTELGDEYIAVPVGESADSFHGVVRLNGTGKDIWQWLADGLSENEIALRLMEEYDEVDQDHAQKAVKSVVEKLKEEGLLTE